jgi:esterase/lipase
MKKKCLLMSIHYKDKSLVIKENCDEYINHLDNYYNKYSKEHKKHWKDYIRQLDLIISDWSMMMDKQIKNVFIENIYVLTLMGKIKQDNYNGLNFIYELT